MIAISFTDVLFSREQNYSHNMKVLQSERSFFYRALNHLEPSVNNRQWVCGDRTHATNIHYRWMEELLRITAQ
jgi:hypothetical protein